MRRPYVQRKAGQRWELPLGRFGRRADANFPLDERDRDRPVVLARTAGRLVVARGARRRLMRIGRRVGEIPMMAARVAVSVAGRGGMAIAGREKANDRAAAQPRARAGHCNQIGCDDGSEHGSIAKVDSAPGVARKRGRHSLGAGFFGPQPLASSSNSPRRMEMGALAATGSMSAVAGVKLELFVAGQVARVDADASTGVLAAATGRLRAVICDQQRGWQRQLGVISTSPVPPAASRSPLATPPGPASPRRPTAADRATRREWPRPRPPPGCPWIGAGRAAPPGRRKRP